MAKSRRRAGEGSIFVSADGVWNAAVWVGSRRIRRRRQSREAAELALAEIIAGLDLNEVGRIYFQRLTGSWKPAGRPRARSRMSRRLRWEILERDGFRCVYCGATAADSQLVVDHVRPVADGGTDDRDNLATACRPCNEGKADRPLLRRPPAIPSGRSATSSSVGRPVAGPLRVA